MGPAGAVVPVHIVKADLKALIRAGAQSPVQFAVLIPQKASASNAGNWTTSNGTAIWRYGVQVPTAVSMSFHATGLSFPVGAVLIVRGTQTTTSYRARDLHRGELWSRIQPGDALEFELTVPAADRARSSFALVSVQAGYRSLGAGVKDHPYYTELRAHQAAASGNASCVTNYECAITASNTPPGAATAGLVVQNLYECTGTLINDVPGDNTPYMLTARHCESGKAGGGDPGAASSVTVYWDATSPCGPALGSLYDPGIPMQTGAQTIVEQQDAWLIELDANPVVSDAQFAGFDASGGAVQGGYTIHHAEGYDKQYVAWFGQAAAVQESDVLGTTYLSNFWETVNKTGNVGPGASGSALFDQNNHLVGSLTLGRTTTDPSGYGSCPVANPPVPNGTNGVADFTSLAAVWASISDTTSSTGTTTLKSVLDPGGTGTVVVPSAPVAVISLSASAVSLSIGQSTTLTWNAPTATQCAAGGGFFGDGWTGTLAASGSKSVTESAANLVTYSLNCSYPGTRTAKTTVAVSWLGPTPQLQFNGPTAVWTSAPVTLSWTSNVTPCAINGGALSLTNLPASGTTTTTQATAADVTYDLTCGPVNQSGSYPLSVAYVTPSLVLNANGTDRRLGETFFVVWTTAATLCTPSGGAPGDGWANNQFVGFGATSGEPFYPTVSTAGTYTYTLSCSAGPNSLQRSVTVMFENNPPYATLQLATSAVTYSASPADWVTLNWNTNLSGCGLNATNNAAISYDPSVSSAQASGTLQPSQSGSIQVTLDCYPVLGPPTPATASATLMVLPPPPPTAAITFNPAKPVAGQIFDANWSTNNAGGCTQTGGIPGGQWGGSIQGVGLSGFDSEAGAAGQYTFTLNCSSIDPNVAPISYNAVLTIAPFGATLTTSSASVSAGGSFTLTWSSPGATDCTAGGGGANGTSWSGSIGASGSTSQTASTSGTFTYTINCTDGNGQATSQATVKVSGTSGSSGGSGSSTGGGGGGGAGSAFELTLLAILCALRFRGTSYAKISDQA